ncbi:hypothetical protein MTO96_019391 [Rhipicephalus appendiculatus]
MTAHENCDYIIPETISEASEIGVGIKVEPNDGHEEAHADANCWSQKTIIEASELAASRNVNPSEMLMTSHEDINIQPVIKAKLSKPSMTAHEDGDSMPQEEISEATEVEVCIQVEPEETYVAANGDVYYVLQEMTGTASGITFFVRTEPHETEMIVHENSEFMIQENTSKASELAEACIKVEPTGAETVREASEMDTCFVVEPNEICVAASEGAACVSPLAGGEASGIETCTKFESKRATHDRL